jgi:hypothetical protein
VAALRRAAARVEHRELEPVGCLEGLHHPVEGAEVDVHPLGVPAVGAAKDRGHQHPGFGDQRPAGFGHNPGFVVVSGPPASGKSTLAPVLATALDLPCSPRT